MSAHTKPLLGLTLIVLVAHLALLQAKPLTLGLARPQLASPFITRTLAPPHAKPPVDQASAKPKAPPARANEALASAENVQTTPPTNPGEHSVNEGSAAHGLPASTAATIPVTAPEHAPDLDSPPAPTPPLAQAELGSKFNLPGAVRLKYAVESNKFPFSANGEMLWQQDGESYELQQEWGAFGVAVTRTSKGQITPAGLEPLRFSHKYRSEVAAHFEREKGKISFSANTPDVPLQAGAQDQLSLFAQLAALLSANPTHFHSGMQLSIQVAGPRAADSWVIAVMAEEKIVMPGGELMVLKLLRNPSREYDQRLELWMAPSLNFFPARIRITEPNGDFIEQKWLATEPLN